MREAGASKEWIHTVRMAAPDYLEQVVVSGRARHIGSGSASARSGFFYRPSVASLIWATVDLLTIGLAALLAVRFRAALHLNAATVHTLLHRPSSNPLLYYTAWYAFLVIVLNRSYGLYGPILSRNGLNEQRMTVQAGLIAGLLLCGTLYLSRAEDVSRAVMVLLVLFSVMLLCVRRGV